MSKTTPKQTGSFSSFDGTSIHYEVRGEGEPLVFVYGLACLINHWHFQLDDFAKTHKVIAFDIRGHHKSSVPEDRKNITLEACAKDLPYLFRELGIKKAHVFGHSLGAPIILKAYGMSPEIFKSITLINGFARSPIKGMFGLDIVEPIFRFVKSQYEKSPQALVKIWRLIVANPLSALGAGLLGGFNLKLTQFKDIEIYAQGVASIPMEVFLLLFEDLIKFNGEDIAASVAVPTLIISGAQDLVTPQKMQEDLHHLIKNSLMVKVPYGSHCTQLDFPDYINLRIEKFLGSL
jgi:pimeloyl-ACP methyl ester carboxylesterase